MLNSRQQTLDWPADSLPKLKPRVIKVNTLPKVYLTYQKDIERRLQQIEKEIRQKERQRREQPPISY